MTSRQDEGMTLTEKDAACPTCGAVGVTACTGLDGADHPDRPPFFDAKATAALDIMARARVTRGDNR